MRHVGGLGRVDQRLLVRADRHTFRLHADGDLGDHVLRLDVDDGHQVVVLVGDVERIAGGIEREKLGVRSGRKRVQFLVGIGVEDPHRVVVGGADIEFLAVGTDGDAARPVAGGKLPDLLPGVAVEHGHAVTALIGDENLVGERRRRQGNEDGQNQPARVSHANLQTRDICFPAGRCPAYPAVKPDAGNPPAAKRKP